MGRSRSIANKLCQNNGEISSEEFFTSFGTFRGIVSDKGTYFCNQMFSVALVKYEIKHNVATT